MSRARVARKVESSADSLGSDVACVLEVLRLYYWRCWWIGMAIVESKKVLIWFSPESKTGGAAVLRWPFIAAVFIDC